jgi:hypothetical protein
MVDQMEIPIPGAMEEGVRGKLPIALEKINFDP